ncbi:MAG: LuxR C-terminal-related transcriptional regulator [Syntrophobacteraceae bacterium]
MAELIRILLVNDYKIMSEGLRCLISIQPEMEVVGEVTGEAGAAKALHDYRPDITLVMSNGGLIEKCIKTISRIKQEDPSARILVLSNFMDDEEIYSILRTGVLGYIVKDQSPEELFAAIRSVSSGKSSLDSSVIEKLIQNLNTQDKESAPKDQLTEREIQILKFVAAGLSNKAIADKLTISEKTVRTHVSNILSKLDLRNRTQAALYAIQKRMA